MTLPTPLDRFRSVLAGATRAIARDSDADVVFASDASGQSPGKIARVVSPGPGLEPRLVAEARGAADALAVRLRYHDPKLHAHRAPVSDSDGAMVSVADAVRPLATPAPAGAALAAVAPRPVVLPVASSRTSVAPPRTARMPRPETVRHAQAQPAKAKTTPVVKPVSTSRREAARRGQASG